MQFTGAGKVIINGGTITAKEPYTEFPAKDVAEGDGSLHDGAALSLVTRGGGYQDEGQTMTAEINGGVLTSAYNAAVATYRVAKKDGMWKVGNACLLYTSLLAAAVALGVLGAVVQFRTTRPKT